MNRITRIFIQVKLDLLLKCYCLQVKKLIFLVTFKILYEKKNKYRVRATLTAK